MNILEASEEYALWATAKNYAPRTVEVYRGHVRRFMDQVGRDTDLKDIGPMDVVRYNVSMRKAKYADSSVAFAIIAIRQMYKFLFLRKLVDWDYELIQVPKYLSKPYRAIEPKEAKEMVHRVRGQKFVDKRNRAIIAFLYTSGVRNSELCDLRMADLNVEKHYACILTKKNNKKRMIFWDDVTHKFLLSYLDERQLWARSEYVFVSFDRRPANTGKKLTTRSVQRLFVGVRTEDDTSPHCCRHGFGSRAVRSKSHARYIQKFMGHKHINSSEIYMDTYDEDVVREYKAIDHEWAEEMAMEAVGQGS